MSSSRKNSIKGLGKGRLNSLAERALNSATIPTCRVVELKHADHGRPVLNVQRIFELANRAYFLYVTRNAAERGHLLNSVLLNCTTNGVSLWPTYRKPFDLIFQRAKNEEWSGREDLNLRPPGPEFKDRNKKE